MLTVHFTRFIGVTTILLSTVSFTFSQKKNDLLDRNFWKEKPTLEVVKKKISEGHDPVAFDVNQFDATTLAINAKAPTNVVLHLLNIKGNDPNKITHDGRTYMFWAAWQGNMEVMEYLVKNKANLKHIDEKGSSIMIFAASTGQKEAKVFDYLIKNGADIKLEKSKGGANVLLLVSPFLATMDEVNYFTNKGLDLKATDEKGYNVFAYASTGGNKEFLNQLIQAGVDPKAIAKDGGNVFIKATQGSRYHTNDLNFYQYLESLGINPNTATNEGLNPLHNLARTKDGAIVDYFIAKGANVNQPNGDGNTPLMLAAGGQQDLDIFNKFFEKGEKLNHKNKEGQTALTYAVMRNSTKVCLLLIGGGASGVLKDNDGNNMSYYLIRYYNNKEDYDAKLKMLYTFGFSHNQVQGNGNTLYHIAVQYKNTDVIKAISSDKSISINSLNKDGLAPIHLAASSDEDGSLLKLLIELGADKSLVTEFGESTYDLASENELLKANNIDLSFLK